LDLTEFVGSAQASSHDGTSAYQLRMGLFRVVCTNGLIVSKGAFPAYCVSHRGNVVDEVIEAALKVSEQFETLAVQVERMEQRRVMKDEQLRFAERALALRYPDPMSIAGMAADAFIRYRVTPEIKALVRALSRRDQITESALVKQLLEVVLRSSVAAGMTELEVRRTPRDMRLYVGDVKPVGSGVSEMRIDHGPGYRVYYQQRGSHVVLLLCGGDKRTQRADIRQAIKLAEDWQQQGKAKPTAQPKASKKR
jgi:putative addiction module killer protein